MNRSSLHALSPLDGRYAEKLQEVAIHWSEFALIQNRLRCEVDYLLFLSVHRLIPQFSSVHEQNLLEIVEQFSLDDAGEIKKIEEKIHHDVKAVEYFLRDRMEKTNIPGTEWIHIGLTSEDTNSIAYGIALQASIQETILPTVKKMIKHLFDSARHYKSVPMLARTHGQPAVPTTVGREFVVFAKRLAEEWKVLLQFPVEAKCSGAVGTYAAQSTAFAGSNWIALSQSFIASFNLKPNTVTTQILPADSYTRIFDSLSRINSILLGLNQDCWRYCSDGYFIQTVEVKHVGSSTMPQKVNPIDFENSEGNIGLANALLAHFSEKMMVSRLQRDLSDSTVKRSIGSALGYCVLSYQSCLQGLEKIAPNAPLLSSELLSHWEVVTEGIQTILRTSGDLQAYERLKSWARGKEVTQAGVQAFINGLDVKPKIKKQLLALTPVSYIGLSELIVDQTVQEIKTIL